MKSRYKLRMIRLLILFALLIIADRHYQCNVEAANITELKNGAMRMSAKEITAQVSFGYRGYTKYGKDMKVSAVINNEGKPFSGKFRLTYQSGENSDMKMIQKSFVVGMQESKRVQFTIPLLSESQEYIVSICDNSGNVYMRAHTKVDADTDITGIYMGILSDTPAKLGYVSDSLRRKDDIDNDNNGVTGRVFDMSACDFETISMLDSVDIILLDNYDTGKFSRNNIRVLKRWIATGGTLVVGTGSNYQKEFEKLHSTLIRGYIGKTERISTSFGWNEKEETDTESTNETDSMEIDIVNLRLNEDSVLIDDGRKLMISKELGNGSIIVAEFSFNIPKKFWKSYGKALIYTIESNLSEGTKKKLLMQSENVSYGNMGYSYMDEALKINENDVLPNMKLYGCILGIYVIIAGPGMYLFFRRRKKRGYLWIAVPILSVAFSAIIYIVGTSTRIQRPYINYLSQIVLGNDKNAKAKDMSTLFSVTSISNNPFSISLRGECNITPKNTDAYYIDSKIKGDNVSDYEYGVEYNENNTRLLMNRLSSFQGAEFLMKQRVRDTGTVSINVSENDMRLIGTVTNTLGYALNNCMIYYQGNLLYIGDIEKGETIDVNKYAKSGTYNSSDYGNSVNSMIESAMGGNMYSNSMAASLRRKVGVVEEYFEDNSNAKAWFYGFVSDDTKTGFRDKFNYDLYGVTGVCRNFEMSEQIDGYDVIESLETYAANYKSEYTNGYDVYSGTPERFSVTYKFPKSFVLKELLYSKQTSGGCEFLEKGNKYSDYGFFGTVSVRNKQTNKLEKLFSSGKEIKIRNMNDYLEPDGSLILYYSIEHKSNKEVGNICLPEVKLVGEYEKETEKYYFSNDSTETGGQNVW